VLTDGARSVTSQVGGNGSISCESRLARFTKKARLKRLERDSIGASTRRAGI
jgi:hypothetical protein